MELFRWRGVICFTDNFPIQQKDRLFLKRNVFNFIVKKPAYCWMGKLSGKLVTSLYLKSSMVSVSQTQ